MSYRPHELFTKDYKLIPELKEMCPTGNSRMSANPNTNGGLLLKELRIPDFADYAIDVPTHGTVKAQDTLELGKFIRDIIALNPSNYRLFSPDEIKSNRLHYAFESSPKNFNANLLKSDEHLMPDGRIMDCFLSENMCEGWLEGYLLTGRHGSFASYESFIRVVDSMVSQHAKWLKVCNELPWRKDIASLNILLTSNVWQQDHNGYTHQDPGFLDHIANKKADVVRMYLPPDTNCLLSCYDHCIRSKNYVNAIVASKHPTYQWLSMKEAIKHCTEGVSEWQWASNCISNPDIVIACCGDTPTIEALAATTILNDYLPDLKIRFINVVDLMKLGTDERHSHGLTDTQYNNLFTTNKPIFFIYHGYPTLIHELTWSRKNRNINVFGYLEEGTITTPFDVRVQNKIDRFNVVKSILEKLGNTEKRYTNLNQKMDEILSKHNEYVRKFGQDIPEVRNWQWHAPSKFHENSKPSTKNETTSKSKK
jgi:xylulose-5-phosphate/fructose-6-phosphate phosphoketolase